MVAAGLLYVGGLLVPFSGTADASIKSRSGEENGQIFIPITEAREKAEGAEAQFNLGVMYAEGLGVPQDDV